MSPAQGRQGLSAPHPHARPVLLTLLWEEVSLFKRLSVSWTEPCSRTRHVGSWKLLETLSFSPTLLTEIQGPHFE